MNNCLINGSLGHGVYLKDGSVFSGFMNNVIRNCGQSPVYLTNIYQVNQLDSASDLSHNQENFISIEMPALILGDSLTIENPGVPYHLSSLSVDNSKLTVKPGAVLMFNPGSYLQVKSNGTIIAEGTEKDTIIFTSIDASPGSWNGLKIETQLSNSMKNCVVEYAGRDNGANLDLQTGKLNIIDCIIRNSGKYGAMVSNSTTVTGSGVSFLNCQGGNVYNKDSKAISQSLP
jgi:hypothetical protein